MCNAWLGPPDVKTTSHATMPLRFRNAGFLFIVSNRQRSSSACEDFVPTDYISVNCPFLSTSLAHRRITKLHQTHQINRSLRPGLGLSVYAGAFAVATYGCNRLPPFLPFLQSGAERFSFRNSDNLASVIVPTNLVETKAAQEFSIE